MAVRTACNPDVDHKAEHSDADHFQLSHIGTGVPLNGPAREHSPPQDGTQDSTLSSDLSLSELARVLRLEKYQSRKCRQVQQELYSVSIVAARTARLVQTARSVRRTLAECIRSEDKQSFVNLFNAFNDALSECCEPPNILQDDTQALEERCHGYPASFLDVLSVDSRTTLLDFLTRVRQDGNFVADRLAALSHKELVALLPERGLSRSDDSVFGYSPRSSFRTSKQMGFVVDGQTELLSSCELASPLEVLVHSVRGMSGNHLENDETATDVWATVCARLISEQKPGSEKLVPAVIDVWASACSWAGKSRLEIWLLRTLQKGSFLQEQRQKQSFGVRLQGRQDSLTGDDNRQEMFYTDAVVSLLRLLVDPIGASVIPEAARKLCRGIYNKLQHSPRHQRSFPNFAITRWLFSSFLSDAIALPETHGMLSDYFISDNARQYILREVAGRCQKAVFDAVYSWRHGDLAPRETTQLVRELADRFQDLSNPEEDAAPSILEQWPRDDIFVTLSSADVSTLVNALYPSRRAPSLSDRDPSHSGLHSSASSISGFSLFQSIGGIDPILMSNSSTFISDEASQINMGHSGYLNPTSDPSREADSVTMYAEPDGERLREVCVTIEDQLTSGPPTASAQWSVLVCDTLLGDYTSNLSTMHETLLGPPSPASKGAAAHQLPSNIKISRNVIEELLLDDSLRPISGLFTGFETQPSVLHRRIAQALNQRIKRLEGTADFVSAHSYSRKLRVFHTISTEARHSHNLESLLNDLREDKNQSLKDASSTSDTCNTYIRSMRLVLESLSQELFSYRDTVAELRDKMWYVADVRVSAIYDEACSIASALRAMNIPQQPARTRLAHPSRNLNGAKASGTTFQVKTEAQILDLLSAPPNQGGRNKLTDDHSKALVSWMERNTVENFCRGEERLHKLCMEIRKAVDQLTAEGSALRSSTLFSRDRPRPTSAQTIKHSNSLWTLHEDRRRFDMLTLHTDIKPSQDTLSNGSSHPLSARSSRDYLDSWSPSVTNRSSATFWSPVTTEARSPSSVTSVGSSQTQGALLSTANKQANGSTEAHRNSIEHLRQRTTSLFLSDLGTALFAEGSETDRAFWTGLGGELTEKYLRSLYPEVPVQASDVAIQSGFNFSKAFEELTLRFSACCNPYVKLKRLLEIDTLLAHYMSGLSVRTPRSRLDPKSHSISQNDARKATSSTVVDVKVEGFKRLLCNNLTRPEAIFRDLQYVAALVPLSTLENSPEGKAFWNMAAAISSLKRGACNSMVETADSIIAHHSNNRGQGRSPSVAQRERDSAAFSVPSPTSSPEEIGRRSMSDAASLLQITAREGYPVAQRELATLYLTHPELMEHIIAPFSRPRDVFKEELERKWRKNQDPARCDPTTMCVAHHWMSLSSKGGDALATEFLRQREEMERLP